MRLKLSFECSFGVKLLVANDKLAMEDEEDSTELSHHAKNEFVIISNRQYTPWLSSRVPWYVGSKTLELVPNAKLESILPSEINIDPLDDSNCTDFADFLLIISTFRPKNVSDYMRTYIFTHMRLIVRVCNPNVIHFCKQLATTPVEILSLLEYADDGSYNWIQPNMCDYLLTYIRQNRFAQIVQHLNPGVFKYVCLHTLR